ncbi:hypothetical protein [Mycolicibacterium sphagni]|uniref:hypothetical protein n=1 Tax=Mycolicibacterium sphagni TaxID=1786 RepID=UPI0021F3692C|nr:hypothetical protein [Mycolicibacterium sphagni]MCV7174957.1 hypothetical protein [Mycolicibacterium sphagni]
MMAGPLRDYTERELRLAVAQERNALILERRGVAGRLSDIDTRLSELDKADALLEGGYQPARARPA